MSATICYKTMQPHACTLCIVTRPVGIAQVTFRMTINVNDQTSTTAQSDYIYSDNHSKHKQIISIVYKLNKHCMKYL